MWRGHPGPDTADWRGRRLEPGAAGPMRIEHTDFVEFVVERQSRCIGLAELVAGEHSQDIVVVEVVGMEAQPLEALLESDTLWIASYQVQVGWRYTGECPWSTLSRRRDAQGVTGLS